MVPTRSAGSRSGRELEAGERGVQRAGQRLDGEGFGQSGHAFEQDVAVAEQADQQAVHQPFLADEDLAHFIFHGLDPAAGFGDSFLQVVGSHRFGAGLWHADRVRATRKAKPGSGFAGKNSGWRGRWRPAGGIFRLETCWRNR